MANTGKHPLMEVFGFPVDNHTKKAKHFRDNKLCPFNNKVPSCTKNSVEDPLGVCSLSESGSPTIICPIRFRQDWQIASDAAKFFFSKSTKWTTLTEVRLNDKNGKSAGNIDVVLAAMGQDGRVVDFGALEVQAVYISGNITRPFQRYMSEPKKNAHMDWASERNYPRPDYLSSSRKRLAPQLIFKGGILRDWKKKLAIAVHRNFFLTLPRLKKVSKRRGEIAWLVYDLKRDKKTNQYDLRLHDVVYTLFDHAIEKITKAEAGPIEEFFKNLQKKVDKTSGKGKSPDAPALIDIVGA